MMHVPEIVNIEAEEAVIGSVLLDQAALLDVQEILTPADFYTERLAWVYTVMLALHARGQPVDLLTVHAELERTGKGKILGRPTLGELITRVPSAVYAAHYAGIVKQDAQLRGILATGQELARGVYERELPEALAAAGIKQLEATVGSGSADKSLLLGPDTSEVWARCQFEREIAAADKAPRMDLPWNALRGMTEKSVLVQPRRAGTMAIVAAPSSAGKTAFAECVAEWWARKSFQVAFFHFELTHQFMLDRRMCRWSGTPMAEVELGLVDERTHHAEDRMQPFINNLHYVHCSGWTMSKVLTRASVLRRRNLCDVVIIDYFGKQKLAWRNGVNKTVLLGEDAEAIKVWCEREELPALVLAQLSKAGKGAERKVGSDIRDTGELEDKANLVITIDREILSAPLFMNNATFPAGKRTPLATVRVDKQTDGDVGDAELWFNGSRFMFADLLRVDGGGA